MKSRICNIGFGLRFASVVLCKAIYSGGGMLFHQRATKVYLNFDGDHIYASLPALN